MYIQIEPYELTMNLLDKQNKTNNKNYMSQYD